MNSHKITLRYLLFIITGLLFLLGGDLFAQESAECLACHSDATLTKKRAGKTVSLYFNEKKFAKSIHNQFECINCHTDLEGKEFPHEENLAKVNCGSCHTKQQSLYDECLHGKAEKRGDPLAPSCVDCHSNHDILPAKDPKSQVDPLHIPYLCGKCHKEGAPVQRQRNIHQNNILENYSESIHGVGLLKKGLVVTATCVSCHTAHQILPHTDSRSTIARKNIANTCAQCHKQIEEVHRKVIKGELWEKQLHVLPACVDCHQPHKVRKVFYDQGMADRDCLGCHEKPDIKSAKDGRSLNVKTDDLIHSRHNRTACSQCHSEVSPSKTRSCETIKSKVNCASCHAQQVEDYQKSIHGEYFAKNDPNAPTCKECHGTHKILGKRDSKSPIFPTNVPNLCARCHQEGKKAAVRYKGPEHEIISNYTESIHGKGLLKSGLVVTAMCTDCHTAHKELPADNPQSSVHHDNIAKTCGRCHHGIEEKFESSIHSQKSHDTKKDLPTCRDCHTAHTITRADKEGFKLDIMKRCGRCHEKIAKTYFDTYHGKVSRLGYVKTAKCYDCHGAHDIYPVTDTRSHLSRENVVATCQKCHPGASRRFAGYLTHATHHDPEKYPWLFWTFWGMTGLLITTFVLSGIHTLLWIPRAIQMRRNMKKLHQKNSDVENNNISDEEQKND